ncbi:hypothetical protein LTR86_005204 [Recurvomyces mirabilis]|nr:hypothetical protein LTR86_005204 [Recurvomyces mirabilis]
MTGLKDLLKKKDKLEKERSLPTQEKQDDLEVPQFKFIRTTTESEEIIQPPVYPGDEASGKSGDASSEKGKEKKRHTLGFRKSSAASTKESTADGTTQDENARALPVRPKAERRLSERLHLHRDKSRSTSIESSTHLPDDLPEAPDAVPAPAREGSKVAAEEKVVTEQREVQWEKRATILAQSNPLLEEQLRQHEKARSRSKSPSISDAGGDENIQEAIRLHEAGDLEPSTAMFGRLANPKGANNALAQVLYGLALRHGWGIPPEPERAIHYLSLAASNSASIEEQALASGMKKGGAAKGELVLAIFELANCFRHGWGVKTDPMAARHYYETAANLGDTDAMDEAAWCLMEGFGGPKDKFKAAQYLRLAEQKGSKSVGNSWIWKEKYNPK